MKSSKYVFYKLSIFILFLTVAKVGYSASFGAEDWKKYIPATGKPIQADIMTIQASQELQKLLAKLQEGLKKNQEWSSKFMSSIPPGQPLPYHENFGLTKKEFARMMELSQKQTTLQKNGSVELTFQALGDGRIKIVAKPDFALHNLVISTDKVESKWGNLNIVTRINNQDPNAVTGPWQGIRWGKDTIDQKTLKGQNIQFCVGKRENKNQGIIYYDGKNMDGSANPVSQFTHILFFPL